MDVNKIKDGLKFLAFSIIMICKQTYTKKDNVVFHLLIISAELLMTFTFLGFSILIYNVIPLMSHNITIIRHLQNYHSLTILK